MTIIVKYFGPLTEVTGVSAEEISFDGSTVDQLLQQLTHRYPGMKGRNLQVAQDHEIVNENTSVTGGEIALLPPFSGG